MAKGQNLLTQLMKERFGDPAAAAVEATKLQRPLTDAERRRVTEARRAILLGENRPRGAR